MSKNALESYTKLVSLLDLPELALLLWSSPLSRARLLRFLEPRPPFLRGKRPETLRRWELCLLVAEGFVADPERGLRITRALLEVYPEPPDAADLPTLAERGQLAARLFHLTLARDPALQDFRAALQEAWAARWDTARLQEEVDQLRREKAALAAERDSLAQALETVTFGAPQPRPQATAYQDLVVGVFVDVANLARYARERQQPLNFGSLLAFMRNSRPLGAAIAYAVRGRSFPALEAELVAAGYQVKAMTPVRRADGSLKANWDVGIAQDILDLEEKLDVVGVASGDGDFTPLVRRLKERGRWVEVYGYRAITARDLKAAASCFVPLDEAPVHKTGRCVSIY